MAIRGAWVEQHFNLHIHLTSGAANPHPGLEEISTDQTTDLIAVCWYRCSLVFPAVGDVFMFSRSGCLRHLDKYIKLPPSVTAPLPPAAEELSASAAAIKQLPPMSCYRVVAVAYRSYPMSEVLKQQQQQVAAAAAVDTVAVGDDDADGATVTAGAAAAFHGGSAAAATATAAVSESGTVTLSGAAHSLQAFCACWQCACLGLLVSQHCSFELLV